MIFACSRALGRLCSSSNVQIVRFYRLPPNLNNFLEKHSQEYNKNEEIVNSHNIIKNKISEYGELKTFIDSSDDEELKEIASSDLENIAESIESEVKTIRDELGSPRKYIKVEHF